MSSSSPRPSILLPALLTLAVTIVRLLAELQHWQLGIPISALGIVWLVPVFGVWFGWRCARLQPEGVRGGRTAVVGVISLAIVIGWSMLAFKVLELQMMVLMLSLFGLLAVNAFAAFLSWPALGATLFRYGIAARLPVVVITFIAVYAGWETHHTNMGDKAPPMSPTEKACWLAAAQLFLWIPFTMIVGGITGGLTAMLAARRRAS